MATLVQYDLHCLDSIILLHPSRKRWPYSYSLIGLGIEIFEKWKKGIVYKNKIERAGDRDVYWEKKREGALW
jgi:hypothetical protein